MFYFDILTDDVYSERTTDQQQVCRNQTSRGQQRTTPTAELHRHGDKPAREFQQVREPGG